MTKPPKKVTLLDVLSPPPDQRLRSAILTTFDLDLDYLERVVLPTLVGVEATGMDRELGPKTGTDFMLELRSRLRDCHVAVLADKGRFNFSASKGLETYELLFAGSYPAFHPKISMLAFDKDFRIVVSSANLTEPGYHTNLEVLWMASTERGDRFGRVAREAIDFISSIASREWRASRAIKELIADLKARTPRSKGEARLLHSERSLPILRQWLQDARKGTIADEVHIVSPFFDQSGQLSVLSEIGKPRVHLYVTERPGGSKPEYRLPLSRKTLSRVKPECEVISNPWMLDEAQGQGSEGTRGQEKRSRTLHAKLYVTRSGTRGRALLGSPNFSQRALLASSRERNAEAAIALSGTWKEIRRLLPQVSQTLSWQDITSVLAEEETPSSAWVPFLTFAEYDAVKKTLVLAFSDRRPLGSWSVHYGARILVSGDSDRRFPPIKKIDFALSDIISLTVREGANEASFPIGVVGKEMLPEFPGMDALDYEDMLEFLAHGVVNMRQFLARSRTRQKQDPAFDDRVSSVDKLSRFIKAMENEKKRMSSDLTMPAEAKALFDGDLGFNRLIRGVISDAGLSGALRYLFLLEFLGLISSVRWRGRPEAKRSAGRLAAMSIRTLERHLAAIEMSFRDRKTSLLRVRELYLSSGADGWQRP